MHLLLLGVTVIVQRQQLLILALQWLPLHRHFQRQSNQTNVDELQISIFEYTTDADSEKAMTECSCCVVSVLQVDALTQCNEDVSQASIVAMHYIGSHLERLQYLNELIQR